jgi:hypothetical protein
MKKVVIKSELKEVNIKEVSREKIYASRHNNHICKVHRVGDDKYAFVLMEGSVCYSSGTHSSMEEAIRCEIADGVYEFDTQKEFFKWALKNC